MPIFLFVSLFSLSFIRCTRRAFMHYQYSYDALLFLSPLHPFIVLPNCVPRVRFCVFIVCALLCVSLRALPSPPAKRDARFHAKEPLKEGGRYRMTLDADQKLYHMAKLEITQVVTGDRGEYRALARNKHGEGVATINLNFEGSGKPK